MSGPRLATIRRRDVERRGVSTGVRAALAVVVFALVWCVGGRGARADGLRPADAPRAASKGMGAPPVPSEYREVDQDGIRFSYHPATRERIRPLFDKAGAIRAALSAATGADVLRRVEVRVAAVPAEMVQLAPGDVPASAAAVAFHEPGVVVMSVVSPSSSSPLDLESALAHALAHIALDEATGGAALPAWFHEGFAIHAEGGGVSGTRALVDAAVFGQAPTLEELSRADAQGDLERAHAGDFVRFLASSTDRSGKGALPMLLQLVKEGEPFDSALVLALDAPDRPSIEARWRADRARRYAFVPVLAAMLSVMALLAGAWVWVGRSKRCGRPRRGRPLRGSPRVAGRMLRSWWRAIPRCRRSSTTGSGTRSIERGRPSPPPG